MDFRLTYDKLDRRVRRKTSENLDYVTFVRNKEKNFTYLLIILTIADIIHYIIGRSIGATAGFVVMCIIIYIGLFLIFSRVGGFGISVLNFVYVEYSAILFKEKNVEIIDINNVHYLDVKNRLLSTRVIMRFVNDIGKVKEIRFTVPKYIIDKHSKRFKTNRDCVCERLINLQKVLDKGDF